MATVYRLPGVRLFASGVYRGRAWPPAVVAAVGSGVRRLGPAGDDLIVPPAVVGHEEDQDWLARTDLEAAGWVDPRTVRCEPDADNPGHLILVGDIVNVPEEAAELVRSGKLKYGSSEVYDDFTDDFGRSRGPALRRFALLGGEVPQVKRLGRLPAPEPMAAAVAFSETTTRLRASAATFTLTFAERSTMTRDEAIAAVKAAMPQITDAFFDGMPDEKVVELAASLPQPATTPTETPAAAMDEGVPPAPAADPMTMPREELIAALTAAGQDAALLQGMDDQALRELAKTVMAPSFGSDGLRGKNQDAQLRAMNSNGDLGSNGDGGAGKPDWHSEKGKHAMSEAQKAHAATVARFAEMNRELDAERKALDARKSALKRREAEAFCETLVKGGVLRPFEKADYVETLTRLDDTKAVHSFTEGGKTVGGLTAFARKCKELAARPPVVRFGEKVPGGDPGAATRPDKAAAVRAATAFAERNERALKSGGYTPAGFVAKFAEQFDRDPAGAVKALPPQYQPA